MPVKIHYTIEQALDGVRQGMDLKADNPIQEPLYMVVDLCENLYIRYPHSALRHLPPGSVGVIEMQTRPDALRRGKVVGNGVTSAAVEIMVARANRRPAYMRYGIHLAFLGYWPSATELTLLYNTTRQKWQVCIRNKESIWVKGTWHMVELKGKWPTTEKKAIDYIVKALGQLNIKATPTLIHQAAQHRTSSDSSPLEIL